MKNENPQQAGAILLMNQCATGTGLPQYSDLLEEHNRRAAEIARDLERNEHGRHNAKATAGYIASMVAALECDYDQLDWLRSERDDFVIDAPDGTETPNPTQWAIENPDEAEELKELESAAGDCESRDDAYERIQEDPLSVEVRSDWYSLGASSDDARAPSEFCILLTTGGPACRIRGDLDESGQPTRAWIEYQDWGTPWTQLIDDGIKNGTLLAYCQQFYFGE